jgi:hemolysin activation/secretion protein
MMRLLLLMLGCFFTTLVWAINILPPTVQPERQTTRQPVYAAPYAPTDLLSLTPSTPSVSTTNETVTFIFSGFIFEGATILSDKELLPLYADKIGTPINLVTLQALAETIENAYVADGYILTRVVIPAQEIGHGEKIKLIIVEGFIDEIDIETDDPTVKDFLSQMAKPILESQPLKLSDLESALLLMNDLPGISVKSILGPSPTTHGASRLTIEVSEDDYYLEAHVDNRGTIYTGPVEYLGLVTLNNIAPGFIGQTQIEGTMADPYHEMSAASLTQTNYFGKYGGFAEGVLNYSQVNPGDTLAILDVHGYSSSLQLRVHQPLIRQRRHNLAAWTGYDILNSKTNTMGQLLYLDRIESLRTGLTFDIMDSWQGTNLFTAEISRGVNLFTGNNEPHLLRSRYFGTKDYTKVNATFTRLQQLPYQFAIFLSGQGQYATNPLLAAEEFGVGGEDFGLAYDYFEISGDTGYAARIELRRSFFPDFWGMSFFQPYFSYDGGEIWQKDVNIEQSLASLGGGLRFNITDYFTGQAEVAQPLTKEVQATHSKNPRGFFYFTLDI